MLFAIKFNAAVYTPHGRIVRYPETFAVLRARPHIVFVSTEEGLPNYSTWEPEEHYKPEIFDESTDLFGALMPSLGVEEEKGETEPPVHTVKLPLEVIHALGEATRRVGCALQGRTLPMDDADQERYRAHWEAHHTFDNFDLAAPAP